MANGIWASMYNELGGKILDVVILLFGATGSYLKSDVSLVKELDEKLDKLERTKDRIKARLEDADQRRRIIDQHVQLWLRELDGFALDAEDLLDLVRTRIAAFRQQTQETAAQPNSGKRKRSLSDLLPSSVYRYSASVPLWLFKWSVAKEVETVKKRFDEICQHRRDLQDGRDGTTIIENPKSLVAKAGVVDQEFVGMDNDRKKILELLPQTDAGSAVDPPEKSETKGISGSGIHNLHVIAITGIGGSGKTALVQSVCEEVTDCVKIWIYVKKEHGPERITKEMLESLKVRSSFCNFDTLQRELMNQLSGKKLLLVLDNVDDSFLPCWDSVRASFKKVAQGSTVLVTTRSARVPVAMSATSPRLEGLSEENWLSLFKAKVGSLEGHPQLENTAKKIARKCDRSPLAAKILGRMISDNREVDEWENVLDEVLNEGEGNLIRKTLITSYEQLSLRHKRCFAFCAIFPDGHILDKDELAKCWAALGILEEAKRPEAAGRSCFEELVRLSFIEQDPGNKVCYRMLGLMHEMARSISTHQCITVEKLEGNVAPAVKKEVRHALLHCAGVENEDQLAQLLEVTRKHADRLRTFIMLPGESKVCLNFLPADIFQKMRCLRVLDLSFTEIFEIPNWIGELQLLRYLNLSSTLVAKLPDSVTSLLNLQTLNLSDCYFLHELPQETSNLTDLRHLLLHLSHPRRSRLTSTPPSIGKLTGLQTLSRFIVGDPKKACGLDQLEHLKHIKGDLWISKLENVDDAKDAQTAKLSDKEYIYTLTLEWTSGWEMPINAESETGAIASQGLSSPTEQNAETENFSSLSSARAEPNRLVKVPGHPDSIVAKNVIEQLRPPKNLKTLRIDNYCGGTSPGWLSQMSCLETVRLSHCRLWKSLTVLEMLPRLKHLHVEHLSQVNDMKPSDQQPDKFRSLETATLLNMPNFEKWILHKGQMPNLKELSFLNCPKLTNPREDVPASVKVTKDYYSF